MSETQEWIKAFKISSQDLGRLHSQADPSLSLLHTCLLEQIIPEEDYLKWASERFELPRMDGSFSAGAVDAAGLSQTAGLFSWRQDLFPVGTWGDTLYLLCHEPAPIALEGYRVQHVLAPASSMKEWWSTLSAHLKPATSSPETQTQIPTVTSAPAQDIQLNSQTATEVPTFELKDTTTAAAEVPEGIQLSSAPAPAAEAPEGISLSSTPEKVQSPEGIQLGESLASSPEGVHLSSAEDSAPPEVEPEEEETKEAPEGISLNSAAPKLSFASLTNPVAATQPEPAPQPEAAAQAPTEKAAPAAAPAPAAKDESADAPPLNFSALLSEEDNPNPAALKPEAKVSPALSALKIKPEVAANLPPIPQPFGPAPKEKAQPVASAPTQQETAPSPSPASSTAAASAPQVVKSEWSFTEVSKVTPLKQDAGTVSRTLEFTHLTTSGNSADLEMCKAVSHDEISKAIDDPRKASNIAEVALNSFKVMKTYFPDSIFFVFLGNSLIPWRWTQDWSRSLDTPPGPVDLSTPSIFRIAFQTGLPYHGYVVPSPVNESFFKAWNGGVLPDHVTLMPIKIGNLIAGMIMGKADRASLDYKYSLKYMEGLAINISQTLQDISVRSAS